MRRFDANAAYRPVFSFRCRNLRVEHGQIGIMRTPLHKTITIEHLEIRCHEYSQGSGDPGEGYVPAGNTAPSTDLAPEVRTPSQSDLSVAADAITFQRVVTETARAIKRQMQEGFGGVRIESPLLLIDLNNATKIVVRNLQFSLFRDEELELSVKSSYATISASDPRVVLRGGVVLSAADGSRLISGHVLWDVKRDQFTIPGEFMLDRNGTPMRGHGADCDHRLSLAATYGVGGKKGVGVWARGVSF